MGWHKFGDGMKATFGKAYLFQTSDERFFLGGIKKYSETQGVLVVSDGVVKDFDGIVPTPVAFHELPHLYISEDSLNDWLKEERDEI